MHRSRSRLWYSHTRTSCSTEGCSGCTAGVALSWTSCCATARAYSTSACAKRASEQRQSGAACTYASEALHDLGAILCDRNGRGAYLGCLCSRGPSRALLSLMHEHRGASESVSVASQQLLRSLRVHAHRIVATTALTLRRSSYPM